MLSALFLLCYAVVPFAVVVFVARRCDTLAYALFTRSCALAVLGRTGADLATAYLKAYHVTAEIVEHERDGFQCSPPVVLLCTGVYTGQTLGAAAHALHECAHARLLHTRGGTLPPLWKEYQASRLALESFQGIERKLVRRLYVWYWLSYAVEFVFPLHVWALKSNRS